MRILYYEKLEELYQAESWKLVINIDIDLINKRIRTLQDYINYAHYLCKIQKDETYENMKQLIEAKNNYFNRSNKHHLSNNPK